MQNKLKSWQSTTGIGKEPFLNVMNVSSRTYLAEMKGYEDLYTPKSLCMHIVKAAIVPANYVVNEFNMHEIQAQNRSDDDSVDEFDWKESIDRNSKLFLPSLQRVVTVATLRKCYEHYALLHLPSRMVDKLTKDVSASILRKCNRYPRFIACQKILRTAFYGNLIFNMACFTYDVGHHIYCEILDQVKKTGVTKTALQRLGHSILFIAKKGIYYTVCLSAGALGHAVGAYFHATHGGQLGAFSFELLGSLVCSIILDDPVPTPPVLPIGSSTVAKQRRH